LASVPNLSGISASYTGAMSQWRLGQVPKSQPKKRPRPPEETSNSKRRVPLVSGKVTSACGGVPAQGDQLRLVVYKTGIAIIGFIAWEGFEMSKESFPRPWEKVQARLLVCWIFGYPSYRCSARPFRAYRIHGASLLDPAAGAVTGARTHAVLLSHVSHNFDCNLAEAFVRVGLRIVSDGVGVA